MSYQLDHDWADEKRRLQRLEQGMDPGSIDALEQTGVQQGWHCLELGGGAGSMAAWLANKVAPAGTVLATDLQTGFLEALDVPGLQVQQHDIVTQSLKPESFDLIHSRAVLEHLPARDRVLDKLIAALKPGGWLVLECHDFSSLQHIHGGDGAVFDQAVAGMLSVMSEAGFDPGYGRRIGHALSARGLDCFSTAGRAYELGGDKPLTTALSLVLKRLAAPICASAAVTADQLDALIEGLENGSVLAMSPLVVAATAQKPINKPH